MSNRKYDPWDNPWNPKKPSYPNSIKQSRDFDAFFGGDISKLENILNWILGNDEVGESMFEMKKSQSLKGTVKRNERVYDILIKDVTPDPEEVPDEVSIEWVSDFGEGHEDLKE
jgi:hypothetical protein